MVQAFTPNRCRWGWIVVSVAVAVALAGCAGGPGPSEEPETTNSVTDAANTTQTSDSESTSGAETTRIQSETTSDDGETTAGTTASKPTPAALDSRLYELTTARDPAAYATEHNLDYRNGSVAVLVELEDGATLPDGFDLSVTASTDNRVQAYAPVSQLARLAEHANTTVVRVPEAGNPVGPDDADPPTPSTTRDQ